jgi:hypothetical protein
VWIAEDVRWTEPSFGKGRERVPGRIRGPHHEPRPEAKLSSGAVAWGLLRLLRKLKRDGGAFLTLLGWSQLTSSPRLCDCIFQETQRHIIFDLGSPSLGVWIEKQICV